MKNKTPEKKSGCVCPYCEGEISESKSVKQSVCKPCEVNFVTCRKCGEVLSESVLVCSKCGEKVKNG